VSDKEDLQSVLDELQNVLSDLTKVEKEQPLAKPPEKEKEPAPWPAAPARPVYKEPAPQPAAETRTSRPAAEPPAPQPVVETPVFRPAAPAQPVYKEPAPRPAAETQAPGPAPETPAAWQVAPAQPVYQEPVLPPAAEKPAPPPVAETPPPEPPAEAIIQNAPADKKPAITEEDFRYLDIPGVTTASPQAKPQPPQPPEQTAPQAQEIPAPPVPIQEAPVPQAIPPARTEFDETKESLGEDFPENTVVLNYAIFYPKEKPESNDIFTKNLMDVVKKTSKKPLHFRRVLRAVVDVHTADWETVINKCAESKAQAVFLIHTEKLDTFELKDRLNEMEIFFQALPVSQLDKRITYVDLVIELMLTKKES
jgi:hypothetical protein